MVCAIRALDTDASRIILIATGNGKGTHPYLFGSPDRGQFWCFKLVMKAREIVPRLTLFVVEGDTVVSYTNEPGQDRSFRVLTLVGKVFYGQVCSLLLSLIVSSGRYTLKGCGLFLVI